KVADTPPRSSSQVAFPAPPPEQRPWRRRGRSAARLYPARRALLCRIRVYGLTWRGLSIAMHEANQVLCQSTSSERAKVVHNPGTLPFWTLTQLQQGNTAHAASGHSARKIKRSPYSRVLAMVLAVCGKGGNCGRACNVSGRGDYAGRLIVGTATDT